MRFYNTILLLLVLFQVGLTLMIFRQQAALQAIGSSQQSLRDALERQRLQTSATISNANAENCIAGGSDGDCTARNSVSQSVNSANMIPDGVDGTEDIGDVIVLDQDIDWRNDMRERIMQQLIPFGFSAYDSERIVDIELAALEKFRAIEAKDGAQSRQQAHTLMWQTMDTFREELGEFGYQAYLEAKGLPMRIAVRNVAKRSQAAGLAMRVGDEIERYNGVRVYDIYKLNQLVRERPSTQGSVPIVYRRGEVTLSGMVTEGPIGIHAMPLRPIQFFDAFSG